MTPGRPAQAANLPTSWLPGTSMTASPMPPRREAPSPPTRRPGGPGRIRNELSFGMLIACMLNFLQSQAGVALDPHAAAGHRQHACAEISDTLARLPAPGLIAQLIDLAAPLTS